jgi:hypothetical protein
MLSTAKVFRVERDAEVILHCDVNETDFSRVRYLTTLHGLQ